MPEEKTTLNEGTKVTLDYIQRDINDIKTDIKDLKGQYVTQDTLALTKDKVERLEKIVYGVIALILSAVVVAVMALVIKK